MTKLIYIANIRFPTEKAHGIQVAKMCEAFADTGADVELILPWRRNKVTDDPYKYYGVKKNFRLRKLPSLDLVGVIPKLGFLIQSITFAKFAWFYLFFKRADVIYSRDPLVLWGVSFWKNNLVWETHRGQKSFLVKRLLKRCQKIVSITRGLRDLYLQMGCPEEKIVVAPDGVDLKKFEIRNSKFEIRKELGLPVEGKIVMYTGHLYDWKGATTLLQAAKNFSEDTIFVFVGGTPFDLPKFQAKAKDLKNVLVLGQKPYHEIPYYLKAADVLVLPNSGKKAISRTYTSPLKMFEYMAAERPIVASDLPSIREVLNEKNSILVGADDVNELAKKIKQILFDDGLGEQIASQAGVDILEFTWANRARAILKIFESLTFK